MDVETELICVHEALARPVGGGSAAQVLGEINDDNRYAFDQFCRIKAVTLAAQLQMKSLLSTNFLPNAVTSQRPVSEDL